MMIVLMILLILAGLYLLVFLRPAARRAPDVRLVCDYAHRGLHGEGIPENSHAAFEAACEAGYGIELDVQLSKDGVVMVFHDDTLTRVTGREAKLSALTASELAELRLSGTDERIPTFADVLAQVKGRVPLLVELKGESFDTTLVEHVVPLLAAYEGAFCVESFNPLLLGAMKKAMPKAWRGLLYTNVCRAKKPSLQNAALTAMLTNVIARPDFIAYDESMRHSLPVLLTTMLFRSQRFVWTLHGDAAVETAHRFGECVIFEKK